MAAEDLPQETIARKEAKALGLLRYFTGRPCSQGHIVERNTGNGSCLECHRLRRRADWRAGKIKPQRKTERFLAKRRELNIRWKAKNRARLAAEAGAYYRANKERCDQRNREYGRRNSKAACIRARNHQIKRSSAEGSYTKADIDRLMELQRGRCAYCRQSIRKCFEVDHIEPLSRGGSNWPSNLQLTCKRCNRSKKATDPIEWARKIGRLI